MQFLGENKNSIIYKIQTNNNKYTRISTDKYTKDKLSGTPRTCSHLTWRSQDVHQGLLDSRASAFNRAVGV